MENGKHENLENVVRLCIDIYYTYKYENVVQVISFMTCIKYIYVVYVVP